MYGARGLIRLILNPLVYHVNKKKKTIYGVLLADILIRITYYLLKMKNSGRFFFLIIAMNASIVLMILTGMYTKKMRDMELEVARLLALLDN